MIKTIVIASVVFVTGYVIGVNVHTKRIDEKLEKCNALLKTIKEKNNQFLTNFSHLYGEVNGTQGQFTEMDERIMDMWMD